MPRTDPEIKRQAFERDGKKCRVCKSRNDLHPHHLKYKSKGGKDTLDNLLTLCHNCHREHHDGKLLFIVGFEGANGYVRFFKVGKNDTNLSTLSNWPASSPREGQQ